VLGFDILGAAARDTLNVGSRERTIAVVNTAQTPTAQMVTDVRVGFAPGDRVLRQIGSRAREVIALDADRLADRLFDDHMPANMIMVGAAFQHGCLPLSAAAIEHAIELNGAAVQSNLEAFRWGRAAAAAPDLVAALIAPPATPEEMPDPRAEEIIDATGARGELRRLLVLRAGELIDYQDIGYAKAYVADVMEVAQLESRRTGGGDTPVAEAFARNLFKLMAYKDEYEVARLHLLTAERQRVSDHFGSRARVQLLLHPPVLRALGMKRKLKLGRGVFTGLRMLRAARGLRGTRMDPFGRAKVRRLERALIGEYKDLMRSALAGLDDSSAGRVVAIASLPDLIRGYEEVKLRNVAEFRRQADQHLAALAAGHAPLQLRVLRSNDSAA
jgi:indolepyruvate ferredoxin oxidoreductase